MAPPDSWPVVEDLMRRLAHADYFAAPFVEERNPVSAPYDTGLIVRPYARAGQIPELPQLDGWVLTARTPHIDLLVCLRIVSKDDGTSLATPQLHREIEVAAAEVSKAHRDFFQ